MKNNKFPSSILLIVLVIIIAVIPLLFLKNAEFGGADDKAKDVISEVNPGYKPWFNSIWEPPSGEIASLLFALQAAIGAGILGYGLGYMKGKASVKRDE